MGMDARFQYSRGIALDAQGNIVPCAQAVARIDCDAARAAVTPSRRGARPAALEATVTLPARRRAVRERQGEVDPVE